MEHLNESLLAAWLRLSTSINNSRVVSELTYNESLVCNLLYQHSIGGNEKQLTATDLCQKTNILKSQMNRTLNHLEEIGIISRERSSQDKRRVFISLNKSQTSKYELQHEKILTLLDSIIDKLGNERVFQTIEVLNTISNIADEVLNKQTKHGGLILND